MALRAYAKEHGHVSLKPTCAWHVFEVSHFMDDALPRQPCVPTRPCVVRQVAAALPFRGLRFRAVVYGKSARLHVDEQFASSSALTLKSAHDMSR